MLCKTGIKAVRSCLLRTFPQIFLHLHSFRAKRENTDFPLQMKGHQPPRQHQLAYPWLVWHGMQQSSPHSPHSPLLLAVQLKESGYITRAAVKVILTQGKQKSQSQLTQKELHLGNSGQSFTILLQLVCCLLWKSSYYNNTTWNYFSIYCPWIWKLLMSFKLHLTPAQ